MCLDVYAWARDNYAINHFHIIFFLVFQIFSFQSTWVVLRKTTRFSRRISYKLCTDDSWFSIDPPQCVLTDNTTGTLMYVVNFKDTNLSFSLSPFVSAAIFLVVDRFHDWWFQLMLNSCCCCCNILCDRGIIVYLHLKLWWVCDDYVAKKKVDESELNHLMSHSITREMEA